MQEDFTPSDVSNGKVVSQILDLESVFSEQIVCGGLGNKFCGLRLGSFQVGRSWLIEGAKTQELKTETAQRQLTKVSNEPEN